MASTTFSGPVTATAGFVGDIKLPTFTVATAPSAATSGAGTIIFVSNGAGGNPCVAISDGTNFIRPDTGGAIAAS